jgi:hypothetical protein
MPKQPANRLRRIEREVCRDLDCSPDDELCRHVSTLRLMRENMQARLVVGERVDPGDLLAVDAALKQYLPAGKPATISVQVVEKLRGRCAHCGALNEVPPDLIRAAVKAVPDTPSAESLTSGHGSAPAAVPSTDGQISSRDENAPPPVPVSVHREGVSASRFHSQLLNGHEVAPLKRATGRLVSPLSVKGY